MPVPLRLLPLLLCGCVYISEAHHQESLDGDGDGATVFAECDDADPERSGGPSSWFVDADGDGFGRGEELVGCWSPGLVEVDGDCDDRDPAVNPLAVERCDPLDVDEDCDGAADDADPEGAEDPRSWFVDSDGDGYGAGEGMLRCDPLPDEVATEGDCDDTRDDVAPDQREVCGGVDEDCDEERDEAGAEGMLVWFADGDGDGYGDPFDFVEACEAPDGYVDNDLDCDDGDRNVYPGEGCPKV